MDPPASAVSNSLYNKDLAPTKRAGRRWSSYSIFTLWANDVHSLGNYSFAIGLFALGLGSWQVLLSIMLGAVFLFLLLNLSGFMGEKTGVPFPVISRIVFGIRGAQIPAVIRGGVAIVWFGIQTYLACIVLDVLLLAYFPDLASLDQEAYLGLTKLRWITFSFLWVIQTYIVSHGMEMIRKYEAVAGPVVLVSLVALAVWMFVKAGGSIAPSIDTPLTGVKMWVTIVGGAGLWISIYGTFVLNFCDFTRSAVSKQSMVRGNFWGIPLNMFLFAAIVVVMAGCQFSINGTIIESPADIVATIPNKLLLTLASLALLVLTVAVNLMANFVAPVYALTNLFPRALNFRRATYVSAIIGFVILPWNLYNSPLIIVYFLGGLGALLGPLFGIIMVDYWLIRKAHINVPQLYTGDPGGEYYYKDGVNPKAIRALVPSAIISLVIALLPWFEMIAPFTWFFGAGLGALFYYVIADKNRVFADVDGESIAVESTH